MTYIFLQRMYGSDHIESPGPTNAHDYWSSSYNTKHLTSILSLDGSCSVPGISNAVCGTLFANSGRSVSTPVRLVKTLDQNNLFRSLVVLVEPFLTLVILDTQGLAVSGRVYQADGDEVFLEHGL